MTLTIGNLLTFDGNTDADSLALMTCEIIENSLNHSDDLPCVDVIDDEGDSVFVRLASSSHDVFEVVYGK